MLKKLFMASLVVLLGATACKKDNTFDPTHYFACNDQAGWTVTTAGEALIGKWNLVYDYCALTEEEMNNPNYSAEFKADGTVEISGQNIVTYSTNWEVSSSASGLALTTSNPSVSKLNGVSVYICEDEFLLYNSIVDGCDLRYERD